jgi:hypothetical protein
MTIYIGHHGGRNKLKLSDCSKATFGCVSPEETNDMPTRAGHGQTSITLAGMLSVVGEANVPKLAVGDVITSLLIPTQSYLEGVAFKGGIACGYEFEFVTVKQNGVLPSGDVNFDVAVLTGGDLHTTTYTTVAGVTTTTVTDDAGAPATMGATRTHIVYSPDHNANYFGSYGAIGIRLKAVPVAADNCASYSCANQCGKCETFTATWRNIQHCISCNTGCDTNCNDVVVLA